MERSASPTRACSSRKGRADSAERRNYPSSSQASASVRPSFSRREQKRRAADYVGGDQADSAEPYVQGYLKVGVPEDRLNQLAILLLAAACGLLLGLGWAPIGVAAAAALVVHFAVAIVFHLRADDAEGLPVSWR